MRRMADDAIYLGIVSVIADVLDRQDGQPWHVATSPIRPLRVPPGASVGRTPFRVGIAGTNACRIVCRDTLYEQSTEENSYPTPDRMHPGLLRGD